MIYLDLILNWLQYLQKRWKLALLHHSCVPKGGNKIKLQGEGLKNLSQIGRKLLKKIGDDYQAVIERIGRVSFPPVSNDRPILLTCISHLHTKMAEPS